jgi:hypothetical protein
VFLNVFNKSIILPASSTGLLLVQKIQPLCCLEREKSPRIKQDFHNNFKNRNSRFFISHSRSQLNLKLIFRFDGGLEDGVSDEGLVVGVQIGRLLGARLGQLVLAERPVRPRFVHERLQAGWIDSERGFAVGEHRGVAPQVQLRQRPVCEEHATVPHLVNGLK